MILNAWTGSGKTLAFLLPLLERLDPAERAPQAREVKPGVENTAGGRRDFNVLSIPKSNGAL